MLLSSRFRDYRIIEQRMALFFHGITIIVGIRIQDPNLDELAHGTSRG